MPGQDNTPGRSLTHDWSHSPKHGGRRIEAPVLTIDLPAEFERLQRQPGYQDGAPTGRTLVKQAGLRIVLMALKTGGGLREHHASGPISIQSIAGRQRIRLPEQTVELGRGQLLALEPGIRHDVEAIEDGAFLLTIGPTTYENVSDLHEPGG